jgi:hypothetical protein
VLLLLQLMLFSRSWYLNQKSKSWFFLLNYTNMVKNTLFEVLPSFPDSTLIWAMTCDRYKIFNKALKRIQDDSQVCENWYSLSGRTIFKALVPLLFIIMMFSGPEKETLSYNGAVIWGCPLWKHPEYVTGGTDYAVTINHTVIINCHLKIRMAVGA